MRLRSGFSRQQGYAGLQFRDQLVELATVVFQEHQRGRYLGME
jgi:hypothetical protein